MSKPAPVVVVMGVSGCGKTTVARGLAQRLGWQFLEGDTFHPAANVEKMARGIPLEDDDRLPWLQRLREAIAQARRESGTGVVVACSALKQAYRDRLMGNQGPFRWVYLRGEFELLRQRLETRSDHFMPAQLLASQFAALEEPQGAIVLDCGRSPQDLISHLLDFL
ncbi:MAG: gluconokinase [Phormidium sp. BM_Day4_Bin.17]|nr:gluconokinase [Phormidium sp. BM_Day4_Bin.17]